LAARYFSGPGGEWLSIRRCEATLRLYSAFYGDKLSKTADRRRAFREPIPCMSHLDQGGSVIVIGGGARQSEAIGGVLPIFVASAHDWFPPVAEPDATKIRRKRVSKVVVQSERGHFSVLKTSRRPTSGEARHHAPLKKG
jgi:hypothetical protein